MQWRHATQAARRARCGRGRRAGARLVVVVDEVADEVGDVLVDHQDRSTGARPADSLTVPGSQARDHTALT